MKDLDMAMLHAAIEAGYPRAFAGRSGYVLREKLPDILTALRVRLWQRCGSCENIPQPDDKWEVTHNNRLLCPACRAEIAGKRRERDDECIPSSGPFEGGGKRIIRKTGGLG